MRLFHTTVSIIVPVFNAAAFLRDSIGSVLAQTRTDWELILVDDGSTDNSLSLCEEYARCDSRIRILRQSNNGPAAARNTGMRSASGEFITFLDADDRLFPDALDNLLSESGDADVILGNFCKQNDEATPVLQPVIFQPDGLPFTDRIRHLAGGKLLDYVRHFLTTPSNHLVSYCWARLYRRAALSGIEAPEHMRWFEDMAFNLAAWGRAKSVIFVNVPVYLYRLRSHHPSASMAASAHQVTADMQDCLQQIDMFLSAVNAGAAMTQRIQTEAAHMLIHYAIIFLVRLCRCLTLGHFRNIQKEIIVLIDAPVLRQSLPHYSPRPGNSRILPLLMRWQLPLFIAIVAFWKGRRRYGRRP